MPKRIEVRSTRSGGTDFIEVPTDQENLVAALLREREGYARRGLPERVALVDAQLARLGVRVSDTDISTPRPEEANHGGKDQRVPRRGHRQRAGGEAAAGNG